MKNGTRNFSKSEKWLFTLTLNARSDKYNLNHATVYSKKNQKKTIACNLPGRISWFIVSKAFWRSITIIPVKSPLSESPFSILSSRKERQMLVEWFLLNSSAANKGRSMVNYSQSSAFDRPYLSCNDYCDRWLFQ